MIRATVLTLAVVVAQAALACSCLGINTPPTREELTAPNVYVFRATAAETKPIEPTGDPDVDRWFVHGSRTKFRATRYWNGRVGREVTVESGFAGGGCGYVFEPGVEYLVFAQKNKHGALVTNICTRTAAMKDAPDLLAAIERAVGRGRKPRG